MEKYKAISVKLEFAEAFMEGEKKTEMRTFKCKPDKYLFFASSTPNTKAFAFMRVFVRECVPLGDDLFEWMLDDFEWFIPTPIDKFGLDRCGQKFFSVDKDAADSVLVPFTDDMPSLAGDFWEKNISK